MFFCVVTAHKCAHTGYNRAKIIKILIIVQTLPYFL